MSGGTRRSVMRDYSEGSCCCCGCVTTAQRPETQTQTPTYRGESPSAGGGQELTWADGEHRGGRRDEHCHLWSLLVSISQRMTGASSRGCHCCLLAVLRVRCCCSKQKAPAVSVSVPRPGGRGRGQERGHVHCRGQASLTQHLGTHTTHYTLRDLGKCGEV